MRRALLVSLTLIIAVGIVLPALADQGLVKDTVLETIMRLKGELSPDELLALTPAKVAELLTDEERAVLWERYLTFRVNVPVTVFVATDPILKHDALWLKERGFEATDMVIGIKDEQRLVWRKDFAAGQIGLGVNSFSGYGDHYFVIIAPRDPSASVSVTEVAPAIHTVAVAQRGECVLADQTDELIVQLPGELEGQVLVKGYGGRENEAHIVRFLRRTSYPSSERPDQIAVTISEDPMTSMSVQWRSSTAVSTGIVRYQKKELVNRFDPAEPMEAVAETIPVEDIGLVEDGVCHRHFVTLTDLDPATTYVYSVGDDTGTNWSEFGEFTTAPEGEAAFSFFYMGDIQQGYSRWTSIVRRALLMCPDAAFCLAAGDQINQGMFRDDWDALFHYSDGMWANVPLAPTVGNHEVYQYEHDPGLYLDLLHLPHNGPAGITPERVYAFEYGQVLVVVLDANLPPEGQTAWLEQQLASSDAVWKFVMFHQPVYASKPGVDYPHLRKTWAPIFDKYGVDIAFQGHLHGYLRTYPMKNEERVAPGEGTIYLITTAGQKMYDVEARYYSEVVMERTATFQVIDVMVRPHRLIYRAYDVDGNKLDEFELVK